MFFSIEKRRFRRDGKVEETRSYYLRYRIGDMPVEKWVSARDDLAAELDGTGRQNQSQPVKERVQGG